MFPIYTYSITPSIFGWKRWQAEMDNQPVRFCRRAYSEDAARLKLARDVNAHYEGRSTIMQSLVLPACTPIARLHDRLARRIQLRRRRRAATSDHTVGGAS